MKEQEIFVAAIQMVDAEQRRAYLDLACADDLDMRARVDALLEAHQRAGGFLESPPPGLAVTDDNSLVDALGTMIGSYKLLQQLGEGGMGTVYLAERQHPVKQRVALKIIKQGMDSKKFIARFEAERAALAMMDHPNIAKVFDAGCTDNGRPFFVMELVKGIPVSEFCDENRLTTRERLQLFVQVCQAVHHAHQKGVIHRDIKPSNVLVALYDQKPVPKVIDFGVAKATNQQLTDKTLFTEVGSILGTWEYMSPEQAVLNQLDVDTRTDVYSLGVLLYELLTGETPLDRQRLHTAHLMETLRMIREDEPPKPSTRISSLGGHATAMAAYRRTKPEALASEIRGDLDWIVMKSLEKERSRRYDSASRLSEDVERFLKNELVEACPPSLGYRIRKYARRHRGPLVAASAISIALVAGLIAASYGMVKAWEQRDRAIQLVIELKNTRDQLETALAEYRRQLIDQGIQAALRGELRETLSISQRAENAHAPESWVLLLKGLAYHFGGQVEDACPMLRQAHEKDPGNLAAAAMYVMTMHNEEMNLDEWQQVMQNMRSMEPSSEYGDYDRLFYAFSQIYSDAGLAVDLLTEVLERRQKWPNARVLLSIAQSHRAIESDDITLVESALDNANEAERVIGNNPLLMVAKLWARCVALQLAREHGQPTESIICEADLLARSLEQYKDAWSWSLVCAFYFHLVHDTDREKEAWKYVSGGASAAGRFAFLYQVGEKSMVLQPAASDIDKQPLAYVVKACFMALSGDRQNAKDMYRRLSGPERSLSVRTDAILILVLLREFELARTESKNLLDIGGYDSPWWMNRPRLKFLASLNSQEAADELLASAAGVRTLTDDSAIRGSSLMVAVQTDDLHVLVPLESV